MLLISFVLKLTEGLMVNVTSSVELPPGAVMYYLPCWLVEVMNGLYAVQYDWQLPNGLQDLYQPTATCCQWD